MCYYACVITKFKQNFANDLFRGLCKFILALHYLLCYLSLATGVNIIEKKQNLQGPGSLKVLQYFPPEIRNFKKIYFNHFSVLFAILQKQSQTHSLKYAYKTFIY